VCLSRALSVTLPVRTHFSTLYTFRDPCCLSTVWKGILKGLGDEGYRRIPSIVPPLSILFRIEFVRDLLIDSDHDVSLVRSKAEDRERACEGTNRFRERCGSRPLNVPCELSVIEITLEDNQRAIPQVVPQLMVSFLHIPIRVRGSPKLG